MDLKTWQEIWGRHRGKIIGVLLGLAFGWFAIVYGVLKALFVSICILVGYYIGCRLDERVDWRDFLQRLFQER